MHGRKKPGLLEATSANCLHLLVSAGQDALAECLSHAARDDTVVFLDAGVLHLLRTATGSPASSAGNIFFVAADLQAHGLAETARRSGVEILDDAGLCRLLASHRHCLTWK